MNGFIGEIRKYRSLSIVGLAKNTGKTVCLNYILRRLPASDYTVAVTSIGIDGEGVDAVTATAKPKICLKQGSYFSTLEAFYNRKSALSELCDISGERTSLGRIVTAKVLREGNVLVSGPSSSQAMSRWVSQMQRYNIDLTIVDGALSRLSSASPIVSDSLILTTGAAYSADLNTLVRKTKYIVELVGIELADTDTATKLMDVERGIWGIDTKGELTDLNIESSFETDKLKEKLSEELKVIYVAGALTDRVLSVVEDSGFCAGIEIVVRDFTKIFSSEMSLRSFIKRGGRVSVLKKSKLLALCVNPWSPNGIVLDSDKLCAAIRKEVDVPVYDLLKSADA